jgi:hypothetical protein
MKAQGAARDDGGGEGEGEAEAGETDVGRLAGIVTGGAGFVDFDRASLLDAKTAAALGRVSGGWRAASIEEGEHSGVIGMIWY